MSGADAIENRLATIPQLSGGEHDSLEDGACVMEAVSYVAGEPWSDHPRCVCPVIGAFLRDWNDDLPDDERDDLLRPVIPLVLDTRSTPYVERRRALMAADWIIREHAPAWLRLARLDAHADALSGLPEITDMAQCRLRMPVLEAARKGAEAAWAAVSGSSPMETVLDTIMLTARAAAWDAAWSAAVKSGPAAIVAMDAAWGAGAWAATLATAWDTTGAALQPTRLALQQSALALVRRMIAVTGDAA